MGYYESIQKSVDYVEQHLKDNIDINKVIQASFFSTTHFYRIFQAIVGETVKDYVRKRQLSAAAIEVCTTKRRLIDIAIDYGFSSQEVFTRAFFRLFGITPGRYRRLRKSIVLHEKVNVYKKVMANLKEGISIDPKIILDKEFKVVGMRKTVKPGDASIGILWEDFNIRSDEIPCATQDIYLGLCEYMPNITDESDFTYIACIEVDEFSNVPCEMVTKTIPPSKYAVFTHNGPMSNLKATYSYIYGAWLPSSGYELAELDTIELYRRNCDSTNFDIYIPIR